MRRIRDWLYFAAARQAITCLKRNAKYRDKGTYDKGQKTCKA